MTTTATTDNPECWPALPLDSWRETCATLHMWTQIVGKVRLALTPLVNQWWNVPLYVSPRGLTTSNIPYGTRSIEIHFDFLADRLVLECSDGMVKELPLRPMTVADFYKEFMEMLRSAGIEVKIWHMPVEIPDPIPFDEDRVHASYDAERVKTFWCILRSVDAVFQEFRARFEGKASPVHFFWGSFDLAETRFSGRKASPRPGADRITLEAYSHEVSSVGFWPGSGSNERSGVLFVCLSGAAGIQGSARASGSSSTTMRRSVSSCLLMTMCAMRNHRALRCSISAKAPMMPQPIWANGIGSCWSGMRKPAVEATRAASGPQ